MRQGQTSTEGKQWNESFKNGNAGQLFACLTVCLSLQGVAAGRLGVCWLPEHQGCVVVCLGNFRGPRTFRNSFKRTFRECVITILIDFSFSFSQAQKRKQQNLWFDFYEIWHKLYYSSISEDNLLQFGPCMSRGADDELSEAFLHSCSTMKGKTCGIREGD